MLPGAIDFGVGRILSVLENEVLIQTGLGNEIELIKQKLMFMKSFLEDMDMQCGNTSSNSNNVFTTFVKNIRDIAYQIENIIDEFTYCINRRSGQTHLQRAAHFPVYMWRRRSIVSEIEEMNRKIQEISELMKTLRHETPQGALPIVIDGGKNKWVKNLQQSSYFVEDDSLVGIDKAREKLIGWLLESEPHRSVITVVGIGGSGKTTLAGNIFRSQHVRRHFDFCSWVTISQSYDIEDVLRTMIKEFSREPGLQVPTYLSSMGYRELVEMIVEYFRQNRYLIVLDDVWNIQFWKEISVALPDASRGSRVMITTRENRVAHFSYGTTSRFHEIERLSESEAWELFCKKAFSENSKASRTHNLEAIAKKLVEKCGRLPLAIVALGSMMSTRRLESEWKNVYNNLNWELSNNPDLKDVQRILLLSFNDLPYPLKHCFLYCCIFPEDYNIKRKRLMRMWMAQGFIEADRGMKQEDVADSYLMELVYRNMLQVVLRKKGGQPRAFQMHDMIREIALSISRDERFCNVCKDEAEDTQYFHTRHLCMQREFCSSNYTQQNLRTLLLCSTATSKIELPPAMKLLRALDLQNSGIVKLPDSLTLLFNLKYLNLTGTRVRELPKSIHRLLNLETLITKFSRIRELPEGVSKLQKLRYLITRWNTISGTKVPSNIWELKTLQVMDRIHSEMDLVKNLCKMTQLKRIGIANLREDHGNNLCNSLSKLRDLKSLSLWSSDAEEPLMIDALSPTKNIEKLRLMGKLVKLPDWLKTLDNLVELELRWSRLAEDTIPCIGTLPNLVSLTFSNAYQGYMLCFPDGFHSLKHLTIGEMPHLTEIIIQCGAMPNLQELCIKNCRGLERVPSGIQSLTNLHEVNLAKVSDELVESIRRMQSMYPLKVNHIPTTKHYLQL